MSRNLATSTCPDCGEHTVRLTDLLGKPLEARRTSSYAPSFGTRWDCPCGVAYFVIIRTGDRFWPEAERPDYGADAAHVYAETKHGGYPNAERGKFVRETTNYNTGRPYLEQTGYFVLDLSYWESFNDEHDYPIDYTKPPRNLVTDDAADAQWVW